MEVPIYYGFEDFEKNHLIQFVTYLQKIEEGILKIPKPTLIDYYQYLDEFYIEKTNKKISLEKVNFCSVSHD